LKSRFFFPFFNACLCTIFGLAVGYYISRPLISTLVGALAGLLLGAVVEFLLGVAGRDGWLYRRRALLLALLEMPLATFVAAPYAYGYLDLQPFPHEVCCETPLDYSASQYENVSIQTPDGITLAGWFVPPQETPGAVIVLLHGGYSDRRATSWHARQLIQAGDGVLLYDQRAVGESTGDTLSYGWLDAPDLLAVFDYLKSRPEVDPERIGAVGLSRGAQITLYAAYLDSSSMSALWLDGLGAQRMEDFPAALSAGERFATFINACMLKMAELQLGQSAPPSFTVILSGLEQPPVTLVAAGLHDFERRANEQYAALLHENAEMWFIANAGHLGGPDVIPDEYSQRMLAFFNAALQP